MTSTSLPVGSCTRFFDARGGLRQRDGQRGRDVLTAAARGQILLLEIEHRRPPGRRGPGAAERFLQEIFEASEAAKAAARAPPPARPKPSRPQVKVSNWPPCARARTAPGAEPFKALKARLAFGIDLAAIEGLALVGFAEDLVGRVELGEARGRLRVVLVGVRVQLLGLPAGTRS